MKLLGTYKNGNFVSSIFSDGTVIRQTEDDEFIPAFASNMDIKICNRCDIGCKFCFVGGTKILMGDFSYKNIEDVSVGDEVIGFEETPSNKGCKRKLIKTKVLKTFIHIEDELLSIETEDGNQIITTPNHPFLSEGTGKGHSRFFNKIENVNINSKLFTMYYQIKNIDYKSEQYELGYLVGSWVGDGHIGHCIDKNGYDMYTCRFVTLEDEVNDMVYYVTKKYCDVYRSDFDMKNGKIKSSVRDGKRDTYYKLQNLLDNNISKNTSIEYCCGFLAGIYDSEGHIDKRRKIIRICNTNLLYIEEIERCLSILSINFVREKKEYQTRKTVYNVRITCNGGWGNFLRLANPVCTRKGLNSHAFDITQYDGTKIIKKNKVISKQYVYNFETECHTYIANNFLVHNCHEGSTKDGKLGDILNEKFIDTLHPYQEVAIGGGNVLEHPDLIPFLQKLRDKKVITNITLNQVHFEKNIDTIDMFIQEKLIWGLGVSLVNPTENFIEKISKYSNAVIHVINGILKPSDVEILADKNLKMLILGYKHLRRGEDWYSSDHENIIVRQNWLKENLGDIINKFAVLSFDNLAIEQLNVERLLTQEEWDEFYAGDDGSHTYYIDMVERKFAKSSTAPMDKRYDLLDSVDDMFNEVRV